MITTARPPTTQSARYHVALLAPLGNRAVRHEVDVFLRRRLETADAPAADLVVDDIELASGGSGSYQTSLLDRVAAYLVDLPDIARTTRSLHVDLVLLGHTGCSYVDQELIEQVFRDAGLPFITAADALRRELLRRGLHRVGLLTPYAADVHVEAVRYWRRAGFEICLEHSYAGHRGAPSIYELTEGDLLDAATGVNVGSCLADVIVIAGTGAPSISVLGELERSTGVPCLSVNLALARCAAEDLLGRWH